MIEINKAIETLISDFFTLITPKYCVQIVSRWSNDLIEFHFRIWHKNLNIKCLQSLSDAICDHN
jgi:hypothetical protein